MASFIKRPVIIEAVQNTPENRVELVKFLGPHNRNIDWTLNDRTGVLHIVTLEGSMKANPGDWIVKGVRGEFYPCKPDIFAITYEALG